MNRVLANCNLTIPVDVKDYLKISEDLAIVIHNIKCYEEHFLNSYDYNEAHTLRLNRQVLININTKIVKTLDDIHSAILKEGIAKITSK
jgi:hypothetical protein